jgi:hypothetical protein
VTSRARRSGTYTATKRLDLTTGTIAQQRPLATPRLRQGRSPHPARWREPRATYPTSSIGSGTFPPIPFFDRGTISLATALGR